VPMFIMQEWSTWEATQLEYLEQERKEPCLNVDRILNQVDS
jgi:hypothetical protein